MMDANGKLWLLLVSGVNPGSRGLCGMLAVWQFNELAEEREPLAIGRGVQRTTNLPFCDEYFQMSRDLTKDDRVRSKQTSERELLGRTGRSVLKGMDRGRT